MNNRPYWVELPEDVCRVRRPAKPHEGYIRAARMAIADTTPHPQLYREPEARLSFGALLLACCLGAGMYALILWAVGWL